MVDMLTFNIPIDFFKLIPAFSDMQCVFSAKIPPGRVKKENDTSPTPIDQPVRAKSLSIIRKDIHSNFLMVPTQQDLKLKKNVVVFFLLIQITKK